MKKILIPLVALFGLYAVISVMAQSQSQQPQSQSPVSSYQPSFTPSIDRQGIMGYRLGPGDILDVRIFGQPDLNSVVEIDEEGNISSLPFIEDPIPAKCRTEREVQKSVTEAYSKYLVQPRVSVRTVERNSRPPATITGAVFQSKQVSTLRTTRLSELLAQSGGVTDKAGDTIQIVHTVPELCPDRAEIAASKTKAASDIGEVQTYKISALKAGAIDPFIRPGDFVMVIPGEPVFVTGLVNSPQTLIIKDQITLSEAIAYSGGVQRLAKTSLIHILRRKEGKLGGEDIAVNYDAIRRGQEKDRLLQPYDIVEVREVSFFSGKRIGDMLTGLPLAAVSKVPVR